MPLVYTTIITLYLCVDAYRIFTFTFVLSVFRFQTRMKFSVPTVLFVASIATTATAFTSTDLVRQRKTLPSTARYFLDTSGGNKDERTGPVNPLMDVAAFLPSPKPVESRSGLSREKCLVSGDIPEEFFYHLHTNDDENKMFDFDSIVAVHPDVSAMKKKLLTRQARYTGLLDKLDYEQGELLPSSSSLESASSWIVVAHSTQELSSIATVANQVENLVVLYIGSLVQADQKALFDANPNASIVNVQNPEWLELDETEDPMLIPSLDSPLLYYPETIDDDNDEEEPSFSNKDSTFLKAETLRLVSECLQLKAAAGKTLFVKLMENTLSTKASSSTETFPNLIKGLRQAGYARPQEMDYVLNGGLKEFFDEIQAFEKENPTNEDGSVKLTNAWWEDPEFQKMVKESSLRKEELKQANRLAEEKAEAAYEEGRFS